MARVQRPTFWTEETDQPVQEMPSDEEINKMEELHVEQSDSDDQRETPAFAQEHAETMRGRDRGSEQD